jgi:hypothetical protein
MNFVEKCARLYLLQLLRTLGRSYVEQFVRQEVGSNTARTLRKLELYDEVLGNKD